MKLHSARLRIFVLIGVLFLGVFSVYAETAEEYFKSGYAYYNQGDFSKAISDCTKAIEINPNLADAYNNRGVAYYGEKEYDKAWADVHKVEKLGQAVNPEFLKMLK